MLDGEPIQAVSHLISVCKDTQLFLSGNYFSNIPPPLRGGVIINKLQKTNYHNFRN